MKLPDPADAPVRVANRVLRDEAWAHERLAAFSGRTFTLQVGPLRTGFRISQGGTFERAPELPPPDLALTISPLALPAFMADPKRWSEFVREKGDAELGGALKDLALTLPWFVEQTFARVLGPIVGQRAADTGRALLAFPEHAAQRVTESVARYARDEADLLARGDEMRLLAERARELDARVAGLAARVDALATRP